MTPLIAVLIVVIGVFLYVSSLLAQISSKDTLILKLTQRAAELQRDVENQNAAIDRLYKEGNDAQTRASKAIEDAEKSAQSQRTEVARLKRLMSSKEASDCSSAMSEIRKRLN